MFPKRLNVHLQGSSQPWLLACTPQSLPFSQGPFQKLLCSGDDGSYLSFSWLLVTVTPEATPQGRCQSITCPQLLQNSPEHILFFLGGGGAKVIKLVLATWLSSQSWGCLPSRILGHLFPRVEATLEPGMVTHTCDPSIWKARAGGSLQTGGQPWQHKKNSH